MSVKIVNDENFESEVLNSKELVLVDFYATWCMPCRMIAGVIEEVSKEMEGKVKFLKLNVDENERSAYEYKIDSIPALIVFKDGKPVRRSVGLISKDQVLDLLDI